MLKIHKWPKPKIGQSLFRILAGIPGAGVDKSEIVEKCETVDELWNHSQKHIFSINAESAQQSAQTAQFGRGNISSKNARNTILVLKTNDARKTAMEFFIQSKPILRKEGNDIAFVSSFNFPLPLDICEYFIFVEGMGKTLLIDGIPHIVPPEIAETSIFDGILKLTCWNGEKIVKNPGTMFFRMSGSLPSCSESIEQQACVAALLGMNRFIENAPLSEQQLLNISTRLEVTYVAESGTYKKNIESTQEILHNKLKRLGCLPVSILFCSTSILPNEYSDMSQYVTDKVTDDRLFIEWLTNFSLQKEGVSSMVDVMLKRLGLKNDPGIFNWFNRDKLDAILGKAIGVEDLNQIWFNSRISYFTLNTKRLFMNWLKF